ncbi:hypothetical protein JTB14_031964, partial [Gonioctena quinquepunctata]
DDSSESLIPEENGRIVGGITTTISAYPHQVSVEYFGNHYCGGALISEIWVMTAAHCTGVDYPSFLRVRAGTSFQGTGGTVVGIRKISRLEEYNNKTNDNDIALLKLYEPITSEDVEVVPLPTMDMTPKVGDLGTVTGWGKTREDGITSKKLRVVEVPVIDQEICRKSYTKTSITERMVCAGCMSK